MKGYTKDLGIGLLEVIQNLVVYTNRSPIYRYIFPNDNPEGYELIAITKSSAHAVGIWQTLPNLGSAEYLCAALDIGLGGLALKDARAQGWIVNDQLINGVDEYVYRKTIPVETLSQTKSRCSCDMRLLMLHGCPSTKGQPCAERVWR